MSAARGSAGVRSWYLTHQEVYEPHQARGDVAPVPVDSDVVVPNAEEQRDIAKAPSSSTNRNNEIWTILFVVVGVLLLLFVLYEWRAAHNSEEIHKHLVTSDESE